MPDSFRTFYTYDPTDPPRFHGRVVDGEYFEWLFSMLEGTGLTFLFRCNLAGRAYYPSHAMATFDHGCVDAHNPEAQYWHRVADMMDACDPLAEAVRAARKHDMPIWGWWNWNEFQCVRRDYVYLVDPVWYERPRKYWCSRDGSRFYHGIPAYGDPEVQERLLALVDETLEYEVDGMYLSTRSHSWYACFCSPGWDEHLEPLGFNECVVEEYRRRHGVDIRYDDYDDEEFLRIKGEHFSDVLSQVGGKLHAAGKSFIAGVSPDRYELCVEFEAKGRLGGQYLHLYKDWEKWADEGAIDGLCSERSCPSEKILDGPTLSLFRQTLPDDFPVYVWLDTAQFHSRGAGPFHLANWDRNSPEEVLKQIDLARRSGAAGAFLHSLYHYTACDSGGESIGGYGVLPRTEYFDALRQSAVAHE